MAGARCARARCEVVVLRKRLRRAAPRTAPLTMTIVALSIIGKENQPLYLRTFGQQPGGGATDNMQGSGGELRFHFICHTALDFVEEKVEAQRHASGASGAGAGAAGGSKLDMYLGLLFPFEEYCIHGYLTNTRIKLIAVVDEEDAKDAEMRALFRRLHTLYIDTISNPFFAADAELSTSTSFQRQLERIVEAYNPS